MANKTSIEAFQNLKNCPPLTFITTQLTLFLPNDIECEWPDGTEVSPPWDLYFQ